MKAVINPSKPRGVITAPPSKSDSHRLLIAAGLAKGRSVIKNIDISADIEASLRCLKALGADVSFKNNTAYVTGADIRFAESAALDCGECGTSLRFFLPLCLVSGSEMRLTGSERLLSRPMTVYEDICRERNLAYENSGSGIKVRGPLAPGKFAVRGDISSQFVSGLLYALPLIGGKSTVEIIPPFESRPYVDMTLAVLKKAGIEIMQTDAFTFEIDGPHEYKPLCETAEGDWSNAAFIYALKYLGFDVDVSGVDPGSLQGDRVCVDLFEKLSLGYTEADLSDCPDLAPVLFTFAGMNKGARFTGTRRLEIKESDRVAAMACELKKAGIEIEQGENEVIIHPEGFHAPSEALCGHNDHRIVMSLAVMCAVTGGEIDGAQAVAKSWPAFFEVLKSAGVEIQYDT